MGARLTSVDDLKTMMRIPSAITTLDARFDAIIQEIGDEFETWIGRYFTYQGYSNDTYPGGVDTVVLRQRPVDSLAPFQLKDVTPDQTIIFDPGDYYVDWNNGIVKLLGNLIFTPRADSVQVNYSAGYQSSGTGTATKLLVPGDIARAARRLAQATFQLEGGVIDNKTFGEIHEAVREAVLSTAL